MLAMNRRDRVALHATVNSALLALSRTVRLCQCESVLEQAALDLWKPSVAIELRRVAQEASDRKNSGGRPDGVQGVLLDNASTLRDIAARLERVAGGPGDLIPDTGDWSETSADVRHRAEQAYQRAWGQRETLRALFPVN